MKLVITVLCIFVVVAFVWIFIPKNEQDRCQRVLSDCQEDSMFKESPYQSLKMCMEYHHCAQPK